MLRNHTTYVLFAPFAGSWYALVRTTPEPPFVLTNPGSYRDKQRLVYAIWPDAIRVPDYRTLNDDVSPLPDCIRSLKGKI